MTVHSLTVNAGHNPVQMQFSPLHSGRPSDWNLTTPTQPPEKRSFRFHREPRFCVVQELQSVAGFAIIQSRFNSQRSLTNRRTNLVRRDLLRDAMGQSQTDQSRARKNNRVIVSLVQFAEPSIQIPPQVFDLQVASNL